MKLLTAVIAALGIATVSPAFAEHAYQVSGAQVELGCIRRSFGWLLLVGDGRQDAR
jgi:hypothetical protein